MCSTFKHTSPICDCQFHQNLELRAYNWCEGWHQPRDLPLCPEKKSKEKQCCPQGKRLQSFFFSLLCEKCLPVSIAASMLISYTAAIFNICRKLPVLCLLLWFFKQLEQSLLATLSCFLALCPWRNLTGCGNQRKLGAENAFHWRYTRWMSRIFRPCVCMVEELRCLSAVYFPLCRHPLAVSVEQSVVRLYWTVTTPTRCRNNDRTHAWLHDITWCRWYT